MDQNVHYDIEALEHSQAATLARFRKRQERVATHQGWEVGSLTFHTCFFGLAR
jgi:hypothetical protein